MRAAPRASLFPSLRPAKVQVLCQPARARGSELYSLSSREAVSRFLQTTPTRKAKERNHIFFLKRKAKTRKKKKWTRTPSTTASPTRRSHVSVLRCLHPLDGGEQQQRRLRAAPPTGIQWRREIDVAVGIGDVDGLGETSPSSFLLPPPSVSPLLIACGILSHHLSLVHRNSNAKTTKKPKKQGPEVALMLPATAAWAARTTKGERMFFFLLRPRWHRAASSSQCGLSITRSALPC